MQSLFFCVKENVKPINVKVQIDKLHNLVCMSPCSRARKFELIDVGSRLACGVTFCPPPPTAKKVHHNSLEYSKNTCHLIFSTIKNFNRWQAFDDQCMLADRCPVVQ